jgi:hypothetical protein
MEPIARHRIGVIFGPARDLNEVATTFLLLQLNTKQTIIEFELLPPPLTDPLWPLLHSRHRVARDEVEECSASFRSRYQQYWDDLLQGSIVSERMPQNIIIVSMARFSDNLYSTTLDGLSILALGNWKRYMAPPSLLEFIVFLVLRLAMGLIEPRLREWQHLGTKGCLWDYNPYLSDARYKVLVGYICDDCHTSMKRGALAPLLPILPALLSKEWLGKRDDPQAPAAISAKLGYDLFSTKGTKPTLRETLMSVVTEEGVKKLLKWISAIGLAAILFWLGLKAS